MQNSNRIARTDTNLRPKTHTPTTAGEFVKSAADKHVNDIVNVNAKEYNMPDCFGNPTPGIPPSIIDDFHSIKRYACVPYEIRDRYHRARTDALIGRGSPDAAWAIMRRMNLIVNQADQEMRKRLIPAAPTK